MAQKIANDLQNTISMENCDAGEEVELALIDKLGVQNRKDTKFGKRHIETINYFWAVFIGFCIRVNLSLTIVAMTDPTANKHKDIPTFDWPNRNVILSSFFWGYVIPQVMAGWLMTRYGPKWFLIGSMFVGCGVGFLIPPLAVEFGSIAVIILRVVQGLCQGFILPSVPCFMGNWIPVSERGRIGAFVFAAGPLGTVFSMVVAGIMSASRFGWPLVFHFFSALGIAWCICYAFVGKNTPAEHPSITEEELHYIEESASASKKTHRATPWVDIFTSVPFWALFCGYSAFIFGFWVLLSQIPTYMNEILKMDLKKNGVLTALPYMLQWVFGLVLSLVSDKLTNSNTVSISTARKMMTAIGMLVPALALIFLGQCTEDTAVAAVLLLMIAVGASGANFCGTFINNVDLSPHFAGVLYGFVNGCSNVFGIIAPLIVDVMVTDLHNPSQWRNVFYLASAIYVLGTIVFFVFGSADVQPWNDKSEVSTGPKFGKRHVEVISLFSLLLIGYCIRVNLSLTIVAMTDPNANENKEIPTFDWKNRNVILSAFFWGYVVPQILAGWLMTRYGPKWFLIGSMAIGSTLGYLIPPMAAMYGSTAVIVCRVIQGASQGFFVPGISCFTSRWIPISERGRLGTFMYAASPMGSVISMVLTGAISGGPYGWPMVFHFFSSLGILWCIFYIFVGSNSPSEHKTISEAEKNYILRSSIDVNKKPLPTPWRHIITSIRCWALLYTYSCAVLGLWILLTQIPTYMNKIMKFDIKSNGLLTSAIYLSQWVFSLLLGSLSDYVINRKLLSVTVTRKIVAGIGNFGPFVALMCLAQCSEKDTTKGVILLFLAVGTGGAQICSILINSVDLSPNHSGVVQGIVNAISHKFAIVAPLIVQFLVTDEYNTSQWKVVFYFASSVYLSGGIVFSLFGSGQVQPWDDIEKNNEAA